MKSTVCDTVHHLCNFGTQSDHNLPRKHNFHFDISDFTVALKVGHGHQNCYEKTKLNGDYHHAKCHRLYLINSL